MHAVFGSAVSATAADLIPNTNDAVHGARTKNSDHKATFAIFQRVVGLSFGIATQAIFAWTAYHLFFFLKDGSTNSYAFHPFINAFLATFFAIPHSLLLWPRMRKWITRWLPGPFYGSLFCLATCFSLLLLFSGWSRSEVALWDLTGWMKAVVQAAYLTSWVALIASIRLTGLGYQTGWTPFVYWVRKQPLPRREFVTRGAYRWLRHPVYLSFLGLIWFTPHMTLDHVILTALWTIYIFLGSYFKDRRLAQMIGADYLEYQSRVPGYPLFFWGPLGKIPLGNRSNV